MGLGIALVAARYAKVDVLVHDASEKALSKSLAFMGALASGL
jgi:3-hydroxyacyl-CoA dehydrogenase